MGSGPGLCEGLAWISWAGWLVRLAELVPEGAVSGSDGVGLAFMGYSRSWGLALAG